MSKFTQCMVLISPLFYINKLCDVMAVTAVLLGPCHSVGIADFSKQNITVILTSQVEGAELFTLSFPIVFKR
jgi:hypothetical protein